jgi:hypothetical protein
MESTVAKGLVINVPEFFKDPEFVAWLNGGTTKFTWHQGGEPGDWSDVVVLVDPSLNGEGTDSDMPEQFWDQIVGECRKHFGPARDAKHIMVRLENLET